MSSGGGPPAGATYNQGFGSKDMPSSFGGHGLGGSSQKVYNPYGDNSGAAGAGASGLGGMSMGSGGAGLQSMGSHMQTTQQTSDFGKTVDMGSSLKTTVVDSAGAVGSAMGLKSNKKGILGNPNEFLGSMQN